jgi:hypothetical protein
MQKAGCAVREQEDKKPVKVYFVSLVPHYSYLGVLGVLGGSIIVLAFLGVLAVQSSP